MVAEPSGASGGAPGQPSTVDAVVRRSAARFPSRTALRFGDRCFTYAELDAATSRAAAFLSSRGYRKGDRVAAFGRNSDAYLLGWLGCARAGLVHVPVNYNLRGPDLEYIMRQSGSRALLVDPALRDVVAGARHDTAQSPGVEEIPLRDEAGSLLEAAISGPIPEITAEVTDTDLVQLLYTSGTTSLPKGAMMTHRALLHEYISCIAALDASPDQRMLHALPLYHSAQMHVFMMPWLMVGAENVLLAAPVAEQVFDEIENSGCDSFFAAPTVWVALSNHAEFGTRDLSALRRAYYGASIMPVPVLHRLQDRLPGLGVYNCFGQSEIGPLATVLRPEEHAERPASAGRPVLFVEARCVDADGCDVPDGTQGEVIYRSPQLLTGYWADPQTTAGSFFGDWFRSGDLAVRDDQGYYTIVDRIKDVINTGGVLVASREVEDALYGHPAVAEVAVIGVPDEMWIEAIAAVVVTKGTGASPEELIAHVRTRLPPFKVPKQVKIVSELPRNASGKLLKRVLRDEFGTL